MSGFSSQWLALREPLDLAARNGDVEAAFLDRLPAGPVRILDLASGAGSTPAALDDKFRQRACWLLSDHDPDLLEVAGLRWREAAPGRVALRQVDLASDLETLPFADVDAVTTSAFLDLVSEDFLRRLAGQLVKAGKPFLASLTYDGRAEFKPPAALDTDLCRALNDDQRTDKGFGPALGPDAADRAIELFEAMGYRVVRGTSDWRTGPGSDGFLREFLSGWVRVGRRAGLEEAALEAWWQDRQGQIAARRLSVTVGHIDFAAFP
ncbi:class I SAM-dependent methyltransferase [Roseibium salinum]|uniref:Class I SAM-dependent methyltransferase n=1 Tax=Roseibium salinum TaxID=1604349 RepID=A0ABT3R536_9HYPH|nr:class I SAM-dependent methyltransferase [Roseibium sp. DSM 29163]MCX2724247.1 class I SAM-dependent methyltransferase [Roseibium sp. DSM 29163]MDN3721693.1 class I SAM-dependent methyltransferase [Roseibium salinum]